LGLGIGLGSGLDIGIHTSQGLEGAAAPQTLANPSFLGQKINFSGTNRQRKMKKKNFVFIKRKNGIHSA